MKWHASPHTHTADSWEPIHRTAWESTSLSRSHNVLLQCGKLQHTGDDDSQRRISPVQDLGGKVEGFRMQNHFFFFCSKETLIMNVSTGIAETWLKDLDWQDYRVFSTNPGKIQILFTSLLLPDSSCRGYAVIEFVLREKVRGFNPHASGHWTV